MFSLAWTHEVPPKRKDLGLQPKPWEMEIVDNRNMWFTLFLTELKQVAAWCSQFVGVGVCVGGVINYLIVTGRQHLEIQYFMACDKCYMQS